MERNEVSGRLLRLQEICQEARDIISSLEGFINENSEYSHISVSALDIGKGYSTRFRNACIVLDIKTIQDLMDYGRQQMHYARNLGDETLNAVSDAMMRQFSLKW